MWPAGAAGTCTSGKEGVGERLWGCLKGMSGGGAFPTESLFEVAYSLLEPRLVGVRGPLGYKSIDA